MTAALLLLTPKRRVILQMVASDIPQKEIAAILNISVKTVNQQFHYIKKILNVSGIAGMTKFAIRHNVACDGLTEENFKNLWKIATSSCHRQKLWVQ